MGFFFVIHIFQLMVLQIQVRLLTRDLYLLFSSIFFFFLTGYNISIIFHPHSHRYFEWLWQESCSWRNTKVWAGLTFLVYSQLHNSSGSPAVTTHLPQWFNSSNHSCQLHLGLSVRQISGFITMNISVFWNKSSCSKNICHLCL